MNNTDYDMSLTPDEFNYLAVNIGSSEKLKKLNLDQRIKANETETSIIEKMIERWLKNHNLTKEEADAIVANKYKK